MPFIHRRKSWEKVAGEALAESVYLNRRQFIAAAAAGSVVAGAGAGLWAAGQEGQEISVEQALINYGPVPPTEALTAKLPAPRNEAYQIDRPLTDKHPILTYNNFYEFGTNKGDPVRNSGEFVRHPWTIEVAGLVKRPRTIGFEDLIKQVDLEERLYRLRCVEAWSFTVPWTGFPLRKLIEMCEPTSDAKYVRFVSVTRPEQMPGQKQADWYPWPYYEGLQMDEATNELALVVVGMYGKPLPNQNGVPLRLAIPWKYGYKGPKSIVKIEFVAEQPKTFWNDLQPKEYGFFSNVNPEKPHPRWSQATERLLGSGEQVKTQMYNGYAEQVAGMYTGREF